MNEMEFKRNKVEASDIVEYTIQTENINIEKIVDIMDKYLRYMNYSFSNSTGRWNGETENFLIIKVLSTDGTIDEKINKMCKEIGKANTQHCLVVIRKIVQGFLVRCDIPEPTYSMCDGP